MLGWFQRKKAADIVLADTGRTVVAVLGLPRGLQMSVAREVFEETCRVRSAIAEAPPAPNPETDHIIRSCLASAVQRRHAAMNAGASDWSDPAWAAGSLIESWALGMTGKLGRKRSAGLCGAVDSFVVAALPSFERESIQRLVA